jgi:hypothetical protein
MRFSHSAYLLYRHTSFTADFAASATMSSYRDNNINDQACSGNIPDYGFSAFPCVRPTTAPGNLPGYATNINTPTAGYFDLSR